MASRAKPPTALNPPIQRHAPLSASSWIVGALSWGLKFFLMTISSRYTRSESNPTAIECCRGSVVDLCRGQAVRSWWSW